MNIALLNGLRAELPAGDGRAPPDTAALRHHAWQSAMEQAQLAGWFKPGQDPAGSQDQDTSHAPQGARDPAPPPVDDAASQPATPRSAHAIALAQALQQVDGAARPVADAVQDVPAQPQAVATAAPHAATGAASEEISFAKGLALEAQRYLACAAPQQSVAGAGGATAVDMKAGPTAPTRPVTPAVLQRSQPVAVPLLAGIQPAFAAPAAGTAAELPQIADGTSETEDAQEAAPAASTAAVARSGEGPEAPPVRVHIDWSLEGARVWLGIDQQDLPALTGLARHLERWLEAGGVKLASLVCNGQTIYSRYSQRRTQ